MKHYLLFTLIIILTPLLAVCEDEILYQQNFEEIELGETPSDFLVLEGDFIVQEHEGKKALLLPGTPLSDYGALFGPSAADGLQISARILSDRLKRQFPRFGVGLGGVNGHKLYVTPSKRVLEINKNKQTVASIPFKWTPNEWTSFRFQIRKVENQWIIEGKAWQDGEEPKDWVVTHTVAEEPVASKPSIWGTPYSSKDIWFDDITISTASP